MFKKSFYLLSADRKAQSSIKEMGEKLLIRSKAGFRNELLYSHPDFALSIMKTTFSKEKGKTQVSHFCTLNIFHQKTFRVHRIPSL